MPEHQARLSDLQDTADTAYIVCINDAIRKCVMQSDASDQENLRDILQSTLTAEHVTRQVIDKCGAMSDPNRTVFIFTCTNTPRLVFKPVETSVDLVLSSKGFYAGTDKQDTLTPISIGASAVWNGRQYAESPEGVAVSEL